MYRRSHDRRRCSTFMGERGMRCRGCGRVWFSAVADLVVGRFTCVECDSSMHTERRVAERRVRAA